MTEIMKAKAGTFCWFEVNSSDVAAAKRQYGELFGWSFQDSKMPDGATYSMAQIQGKNVGGVAALSAEAKQMGAKPHLLSYVAVDQVDEMASKVAGLGGKVLMAPTEAGPGRMCLVQDPVGGVVALWQAKEQLGWLYRDLGAMCWAELVATDTEKAAAFYTKLLGWTTQPMPGSGMPYTIFKKGDEQVGGMMQMPVEMKGAPTNWVVYLHVPNTDQAIARALKMGGTVLAPATDVPTVGRIATMQDAQGAVYALLQPVPM